MTRSTIHTAATLVGLLCLVGAACSEGDSGGATNSGADGGTNNGATNNGTNNRPANNGTANNGGTDLTCTVDEDCPPTARCDEGTCQRRMACDDTMECTQDEVCNTCLGVCEAFDTGDARPCIEDQNCLIDQFCDTCRGICRTLSDPCEPCSEDVECGAPDDLCLDLQGGSRVCGRTCDDVSDCPRGYLCETVEEGVQQCVPSSGDCTSPGQCEDHADCPPGQQCGPTLLCITGCTPGSCPNDEVCDNGACTSPCSNAGDCPDGAECNDEGLCRVPGGCLTSRDCPDPGTYCDADSQRCAPGCQYDSDCPGLQICTDNECRTQPCTGNHLCPFGQVCDKDSGQCVEPAGPYCEICNAEAENQCGGAPNRCLRIHDEEGNAAGDFCAVACDPLDLDACPQGYRCEELRDQNDMVVGNVCFRPCHRDPV